MHQRSSDREHGFTLIELLMAITISGIIISALAASFIATMKGTAGAHERFVASNGAHTLTTYFTSDVQSANPSLVTTTAAVTGCSDPAAGTDNVLRLQWSEMSTATRMTAFSVSYRTRQVGGEWQLVRYACSGWANLPTSLPAILASAAPTVSVMASSIWDPTDPANPAYKTVASVSGRRVTMTTFSALAAGQADPYSHTVSADMRTPALVPTVLGIGALDPNPTNATTVRWTVRFSDNVTGVDAGDFALAVSGLTGSGGLSVASVDAKTYTVTAGTGTGSAGTIRLDLVDDDSIKDAEGDPLGDIGPNNGNFTGEAYTIDRVAPTVTVNQHAAQADPTMSLPVLFTATFSEPIVAFDAGHVTRGGSAPGTAVITVTGVSPTVYDIQVTGLTGDGTVTMSVAANKVKDLAGNNNAASTSTDNTVTYQTPPLVTSINRTGANPASATTLGWTVTFNKTVTGVDAADFQLATTGAVSGAGITGVSGTGTTWTVTANRGTGAGTVGLNLVDDDSIVGGGVALGGPGTGNGDFAGQVYDVVTAPAITSVQLVNKPGGTAGRLETGDSIVVTFDSTMKVSSFCSTWSNDAGNQSITGNAATVSVTNNGSEDSLAITSSTCPTSNLGSVNLKGDYVNRDVSFNGNGNNASNPATTVTWDATSRQLTVTLGKENSTGPGSPTNPVGSSTAPVYSTSATNPAGTPVGNSPFTLPAAVQF